MVAGPHLSTQKRQCYPSENNSYWFYLYYENSSNTLLTKMPAELPSTEQIFNETWRSWFNPLRFLRPPKTPYEICIGLGLIARILP